MFGKRSESMPAFEAALQSAPKLKIVAEQSDPAAAPKPEAPVGTLQKAKAYYDLKKEIFAALLESIDVAHLATMSIEMNT